MQSAYKYRESASKVKTTLPKPCTDAQNRIIKSLCLVFFGIILPVVPLGIMSNLYVKEKTKCTTIATTATIINTISIVTNATTTTSSWILPSQCFSYTENNDTTRSIAAGSGSLCDNTLTAKWYRFTGANNTKISTKPISMNLCTTNFAGWYNGIMPSTPGTAVNGSLCVNYYGYLCYSSRSGNRITVTNCDSYYVYYLLPITNCNTRYCTTN